MSETVWQSGDRVVHTARPEWGHGKVLSATSIRENGEDAQRVTVRFDRAGTKTLSTAVARLAQADATPVQVFTSDADEPGGEQGRNDKKHLVAKLVKVPEAATDPFLPLAGRLRAAVGLYRFENHGRSLLDWAAAQSGLADPLAVFGRHELEESFAAFRRALDAHVAKLVTQARHDEPSALAGLGAKTTPEVRDMLTRLLTGR
jgi:hypothetical protein